MTQKQHSFAIASSAFPLGLWLLLGLADPQFVGRMFVPSSSQPAGWLMAAAIFVLAGAAYFVQRKGLERETRSSSSSQVVSGMPVYSLARVGSLMALVLLATFLVVFGPAIVTFLNGGL